MLSFLRQHKLSLLWLATLAYVLTFFYLTWFKLANFGYDNLDLAIFNNSLFNLTQGFGLSNAIHPPSYWGDHASPILFLLAPLYSLATTPLTLLWLQVIFLAACVWPLYLIAGNKLTQTQTVAVCFLWLVNPILHNMSMFEFSLVPFAMFFLLWSWYWYEKKNIWFWLLFSLLALSCREDIALVAMMYSLIAWYDKRTWIWRWLPLFLSLSWFLTAQKIIQHYVLSGNYKFSIYYLWLGESSLLQIIQHLLTVGNLELFLGLLFPLFFLPLWRPKYLLFLLAPLAAVVLTNGGGGELVLKSHYGGLLLWPIFLALIFWLQTGKIPKKIQNYFPQKLFIFVLLLLSSVYASLTYGSLIPQFLRTDDVSRNQSYSEALKQIPAQSGVAATYSFLSPLSSRQTLQMLPYAYGGKGQFALTNYEISANVDYLAIDWQEMIYSQAHYPSSYPQSVSHQSMLTNWQKITRDFSPIWQQNNIMIMKRGALAEPLATIMPSTAPQLTMMVSPSNSGAIIAIDGPLAPKEFFLEASQGDQVWRWPLAYGLYEPTTTTSTISINMTVSVPTLDKKTTKIRLYSWQNGQLRLSALNSIACSWPDQELLLEQEINPKP